MQSRGVMTERNIQQAANEHYASRFDGEQRALIAAVDDYEDQEKYESALQELEEQPLSFQKLATYHVAEEIEWEILLGTGGPADRIIVRTDFNGMIESAEYQYQDWFQPWTAAEDQDEDLVRRYAEIVGYYEDQS
jgi:hypothetical protein